MAFLDFDHPNIERLCSEYPHTRRIFGILDHENSRENTIREAHSARGMELVDDLRAKKRDLASRDQRNAGRPRLNDLDEHGRPIADPGVVDQNGNKVPGMKARDRQMGEFDLESHRLPFLHKIDAAKQKYARHREEPAPPSPWGEKAREVFAFVTGVRGQFAAYEGPGRRALFDPEQMAKCGLRAEALHAEHDQVRRCWDDLRTAEAMVDDIVAAAAAKPPFTLGIPDNAILGPGGTRDRIRVWPHEMSNPPLSLAVWLDRESVRGRLMADLHAAYKANKSHLRLRPEERSRRLKAAKAELIQVELEEAWHLLGLSEQGEPVEPRQSLSPRALLQLVPA